MAALPSIGERERKKPLCYDPSRDKFIYFDELASGKEKVISLESLDREQLKKLVVERQRTGPDYTVQVLSGVRYSRDDVVKEITADTEFGKMSLEAEVAYLTDLLLEIDS